MGDLDSGNGCNMSKSTYLVQSSLVSAWLPVVQPGRARHLLCETWCRSSRREALAMELPLPGAAGKCLRSSSQNRHKH